tara:strand:- start:1741 stop:1977 length:237 start_codon:yes stop_codon:yes gene_type:complete
MTGHVSKRDMNKMNAVSLNKTANERYISVYNMLADDDTLSYTFITITKKQAQQLIDNEVMPSCRFDHDGHKLSFSMDA